MAPNAVYDIQFQRTVYYLEEHNLVEDVHDMKP